jgi:hypothetical protein
MPSNRVKINVNDEEGNKITISFEGKITRNKVLQVLDFVEILGGVQTTNEEKDIDSLSKFDKIQNIIERKFPMGWFTSQEVMVAYEDAFDEPVGLSTVSTYLSRLIEKNILTKSGSVTERRYKLKRIITSNEERKIQP